MSKQHNIHNLATKYNSRLHISKLIEPIIKPLTKKYGVKVDELSMLWSQVFDDEYKNQVSPKKIVTEYRFKDGERKKYRKLHLEVLGKSAMEIEYRRNSIIEKVNEIFGHNFISDLVIKKKHSQNKINCNDPISDNYNSSQIFQTKYVAQAEKSETLEDALTKLGKNIKEQRRNENK